HPPIHAEYTSMLPGVHRWAGQTAGPAGGKHVTLGRCRMAGTRAAQNGSSIWRRVPSLESSVGCQEHLAVVSGRFGFGDRGASVVQAELLSRWRVEDPGADRLDDLVDQLGDGGPVGCEETGLVEARQPVAQPVHLEDAPARQGEPGVVAHADSLTA